MNSGGDKAEDAFRTIGELSAELGIQQHILRYWESRFSELRPLTRAGKRRYYRPDDVALVERIDRLLNREGYTIKGVQKLLSQRGGSEPIRIETQEPEPAPPPPPPQSSVLPLPAIDMRELRRIRDGLAAALVADAF